jgi:NIPSNAP
MQMIVDVRTYTLIPRKMAKYLELFEKHALPVMKRHGLELTGDYVSHIGPLNQLVHLWRYDSLAEDGVRGVCACRSTISSHSCCLKSTRFIKRSSFLGARESASQPAARRNVEALRAALTADPTNVELGRRLANCRANPRQKPLSRGCS